MISIVNNCRTYGYEVIKKGLEHNKRIYCTRFENDRLEHINLRLNLSKYGIYSYSYSADDYQYLTVIAQLSAEDLNMSDEKYHSYFPNDRQYEHVMYSYNNSRHFYTWIFFKEFVMRYNNALLKHWLQMMALQEVYQDKKESKSMKLNQRFHQFHQSSSNIWRFICKLK